MALLVTLSRLAAPFEPVENTAIADAREALAYWSCRAADLPWHRRAARREARAMAARNRARLVNAHLDRWGLGALQHRVTPIVERGAGRHFRRLAWGALRRTVIVRRLIAVAVIACVAAFASLAVLTGLVIAIAL